MGDHVPDAERATQWRLSGDLALQVFKAELYLAWGGVEALSKGQRAWRCRMVVSRISTHLLAHAPDHDMDVELTASTWTRRSDSAAATAL